MKQLARVNPLILIGSLLTISLLIILATQIEKKEIEETTGLKGEARINPLYAHRLFLKRMGIPATTINSSTALSELPSTDTVIYLYTSRTTLAKKRVNDLLDWVKRGGHLITIANNYDANWLDKLADENDNTDDDAITASHYNDTLQEELDIRIGKQIILDDDEADNPAIPASKTQKSQDASWHIQWEDKKLRVQPDFFYALYSDYDDEFIDLNGHHFMSHIKLDDGLVTLAGSLEFLEKEGLGNFDHAELFFHIITKHHERPQNVWLIHQGDAPSLLELLWKNAPLFIISAILFMLTWLWYSSQQFGPLLKVPNLQRRRLMEHIKANGHHLWQHDRRALLESTRKTVYQYMASHYPAWHHLTEQEQVDYIYEQWQIAIDNYSKEKINAYTKDDIAHFLFDDFELHNDNFTKAIQNLKKLMKYI
jgi:hypothetical protein